MAVKSIDDLLQMFDDEARAATFARSFLRSYLVPALGVLPKTEIDLRVFTLLAEARARADLHVQRLSTTPDGSPWQDQDSRPRI